MKKNILCVVLITLASLSCVHLFGQAVKITGVIKDAESRTPIFGATIQFEGTTIGTTADVEGKFTLTGNVELPALVEIRYVGYTSKSINVTTSDLNIGEVFLIQSERRLNDVYVVGASRSRERKFEAPVSVESIGLQDIKFTSTPNFYEELSNLKGVQPNTGSLLFTGLNTRGFADPNNLRFIQLLDGASLVTPGFGIIGNTMGVSELDVASVELIPGASSALYGADAFNGLILINTKDPFENQGISMVIKRGSTVQELGTDPYTSVSVRIASDLIEDKLAFKVDFEGLHATDWQKVDNRDRVTNIATQTEKENYLTNNPFNNPAYDQVDRYGEIDSRFSNVKLPTFPTGSIANPTAADTITVASLNRTGVRERDIFNPKVEHYRVNAGIYYKPSKSKNLEFSYLYKYSISDIVFRITTSYPFYDFEQFHQQFRVKNDWLTLRAYSNKNTANNAFAGRFVGKTIEQTLLPNSEWLSLYQSAFRGDVTGINSQNHYAARQYADSFMAQPGSPEYEQARYLATNTYAFAGSVDRFSPQSGAKLFENSSYVHADLNIDLSVIESVSQVVDLQLGASLRRYNLDSEGSFFNDGPFGFNGAIKYSQTGAYLQASKRFLDEKLKLSASARYDKRQELDAFLTPRFSAVLTLGSRRQHNFRASYQTGFRNPSPQEGYINYWVSPSAFVLGGLKENIDNFTFQSATGDIVTSREFFDNVSGVSYEDATRGLKPEQNTVIEVGYSGALLGDNLFADVSFAHTSFENFVRTTALVSSNSSGLLGIALWYNNIDQKITTQTLNMELEYFFLSNFKLGLNYSLNQLNAKNYVDAQQGNRAIDLRYNTPEHRFNVSMSNNDLYEGYGFNVVFRSNSAYDYKSSFGENRIQNFKIVDATISKKLSGIDGIFKIGGTNIFNEPYTFVYGGPNIGALYYTSIIFNDLVKLFKKK